MQMKSLRNHPDMSYGSNKNGISFVSSPVLTVFTVLEPYMRKRRMLFPIMSLSVQEANESDVRNFTSNE